MKFLLDTHAFIWFIQGDERLPGNIQELIASEKNDVFISIATFWELAIKISLGKLELSEPLEKVYNQALSEGFKILPIEHESIFRLMVLPMHHRDPFDRIIICTALVKSLNMVSADKYFKRYESLDLIWA